MASPMAGHLECLGFFMICCLSLTLSSDSDVKWVDHNVFKDDISLSSNSLVYFYTGDCKDTRCAEIEEVLVKLVQAQSSPDGPLGLDIKVLKTNDGKMIKKYGIRKTPALVYFRHGDPMLYTADPVDPEELVMWLEENRSGTAKVLSDENFEHLTQASTGATTGDWFVLFYSDECSEYTAVWNAVYSSLHRRMNIAKIDVKSNPSLKSRFNIHKCPSLIFFRLGNMYEYHLNDMTYQSFISFADGWYKNVQSKRVLPEPSPFDKLVENIVMSLKDFMNKPSGNVILIAATLCLFICLSMCLILCGGSKREKTD